MAISHIGTNILILTTIFYALDVLAVILRIYSRHLKNRALGLDDYAAIIALYKIAASGNVVIAVIAVVKGGMGFHVLELEDPFAQLTTIFKCLVPLQILWSMSNGFVKLSICFLYISIFRVRKFRIAAFVCVGLSVAYMVAVILETLLVCRPLEYNWNRTIEGHCYHQSEAFEAVGILNLLTDFFIFALPMPVLWGLQLPVGKKIGLTATFGIGLIICAFSVIRVVELAIWDFSDFSYGIGKVAYWSLLEPGFGVICCCIPVLQPVVSKFSSSSLWSRNTPKYSFGHKDSDSRPKNRGEGNKFQRVNDALYPLTEMSIDQESEQALDHTPSDVPQRPERTYWPSEPHVIGTNEYDVSRG